MNRADRRQIVKEARRVEAVATAPRERVGVWVNSHLFISAGDGKFPNAWWRFWQWAFLGWRWDRKVM